MGSMAAPRIALQSSRLKFIRPAAEPDRAAPPTLAKSDHSGIAAAHCSRLGEINVRYASLPNRLRQCFQLIGFDATHAYRPVET